MIRVVSLLTICSSHVKVRPTAMNNTVMDNSVSFGIPPAALPDLVKNIYILNFNIVASSALFFWDILLNLDRELIYIWKPKFSHIAVLYGVIRILAVAATILNLLFNVGVSSTTDSGCKANFWLDAVLGLFTSTCVDILLIFRVYALYGRNKVLLRSLCVMEAVAFVAVACLIAIALPKIRATANPFSHQLPAVLCIVLDTPNIESYIWLPILLVQAILFLLALGRHIYLQSSGLTLFGTTSHIYHIFIRDGIWIFFILLATFLLCTVGFKLHSILGEIAVYWIYPLMGVSASRLIINLRSASHEAEGHSLGGSPAYARVRFINEGTTKFNKNVSTKDSHENL